MKRRGFMGIIASVLAAAFAKAIPSPPVVTHGKLTPLFQWSGPAIPYEVSPEKVAVTLRDYSRSRGTVSVSGVVNPPVHCEMRFLRRGKGIA